MAGSGGWFRPEKGGSEVMNHPSIVCLGWAVSTKVWVVVKTQSSEDLCLYLNVTAI